MARPCHVRPSPQSGHSPELEHGFIFICASMTVLPSIMQAIVQRAPEVEIKTEERDTTKVVRITDALNCTYTGRCVVTVCCVVAEFATAMVRIIATTAQPAARTNGNNFTSVSPEGKYRP